MGLDSYLEARKADYPGSVAVFKEMFNCPLWRSNDRLSGVNVSGADSSFLWLLFGAC